MALAVKRGKVKKSKAKGAVKEMAESMSESQLQHFAKKPHHPGRRFSAGDSAISKQFWAKKKKYV